LAAVSHPNEEAATAVEQTILGVYARTLEPVATSIGPPPGVSGSEGESHA
jgi:hypothetical protein